MSQSDFGMHHNSDRNLARRLFDPGWYLSQNLDIAKSGLDPLTHYLERGAWEWRDPNPLFDSQWYLDKYPEVAFSGNNPLVHYLTEGAAALYDPHPLFDTRTYLRVCGRLPLGLTPLELFLASGKSALPGVYRSLYALQKTQHNFLDSVTVEVLEDNRKTSPRWAVFLQCGRQSLHEQWLSATPKPWHLIANFYDESYYRKLPADLVLVQNKGTKFTAVYRLLESHMDFFGPYDYVLFLDDDVLISEDDITRLFKVSEEMELHLAQPSVAPGSANTWAALIRQEGSVARFMNTVEIMMPLISRDALSCGGFLFSYSISGWGLDFALGDIIRRKFGGRRIAVIDTISALHTKMIDTAEGAYYRMLRGIGISPLVEERSIGLRYGSRGPIAEMQT